MWPYGYDDKFEIPVYSHILPKKHGFAPDSDVSRHPLSNHVGLVFFTARHDQSGSSGVLFLLLDDTTWQGWRPGLGAYTGS